MKKFHLGPLAIDPAEYGSQGNAVLGIRGSGKSYTATELGELLFDAGVPWFAFDPTGIWRFIRVPGKGKGYPIVVAGGPEGDLPLTVAGTPALVRAAMENGISVVFDLHGAQLSKADWRRVVTSAVRTMMQENAKHGLRHVFIEEAAEFVPQRPIDFDVYNEIERLARIGGNARLGYTLINQRSQEVNKAVLELCENVFLHRQRGKNALQNLDKWLEVAGADEQAAIIKSMPNLPTGHCWAWLGGDKPTPPTLITVPAKNSFHPDRRVMRGEAIKTRRKPVDVGSFVSGMQGELAKIVEEAKANDVPTLKARIRELEAAAAKKAATVAAPPAVTVNAKPEQLEAARKRGWDARGREDRELLKAALVNAKVVERRLGGLIDEATEMRTPTRDLIAKLEAMPEMPADAPAPLPAVALPPLSTAPKPWRATSPTAEYVPATLPAKTPAEGLTGRDQRILDAVAWWNAAGITQPSRVQVATVAKYSANSTSFNNPLSALRTKGLIDYPSSGSLELTAEGHKFANRPSAAPTTEELHGRLREVLEGRQWRILAPMIAAYPRAMSREDAAAACEPPYSATSTSYTNPLSSLRSLGLIDYPSSGQVIALPILFVEGR